MPCSASVGKQSENIAHRVEESKTNVVNYSLRRILNGLWLSFWLKLFFSERGSIVLNFDFFLNCAGVTNITNLVLHLSCTYNRLFYASDRVPNNGKFLLLSFYVFYARVYAVSGIFVRS